MAQLKKRACHSVTARYKTSWNYLCCDVLGVSLLSNKKSRLQEMQQNSWCLLSYANQTPSCECQLMMENSSKVDKTLLECMQCYSVSDILFLLAFLAWVTIDLYYLALSNTICESWLESSCQVQARCKGIGTYLYPKLSPYWLLLLFQTECFNLIYDNENYVLTFRPFKM